MEHTDKICSLETELFLITICSIRILIILEVIAKTNVSKIAKFSTLLQEESYLTRPSPYRSDRPIVTK